MVVCGTYFLEPDTILVFKIFYEVFGGGTRLAMPKTTLRGGLIVIESLVQGLLRESWIRGCPDGWTIPSAGLLDYEDTRLKTSSRVRMGLSLAWKASLAIRICRSPTIVTDSV